MSLSLRCSNLRGRKIEFIFSCWLSYRATVSISLVLVHASTRLCWYRASRARSTQSNRCPAVELDLFFYLGPWLVVHQLALSGLGERNFKPWCIRQLYGYLGSLSNEVIIGLSAFGKWYNDAIPHLTKSGGLRVELTELSSYNVPNSAGPQNLRSTW